MGAKKKAVKIQIDNAIREHAEAYLRGEYPRWRLTPHERMWVRRLRKLQPPSA
jgi:hypothetical protein